MELIGTGQGLAAYLNGRAKGVTPKVVRALERALPQAQIFVSSDFDQARRHVQVIAEERPLRAAEKGAAPRGGGSPPAARAAQARHRQRLGQRRRVGAVPETRGAP